LQRKLEVMGTNGGQVELDGAMSVRSFRVPTPFPAVPALFPLLDALPAVVWDQRPIAIRAIVVEMTPVTLFLVPLPAQLA
jgi:hypothetical protein